MFSDIRSDIFDLISLIPTQLIHSNHVNHTGMFCLILLNDSEENALASIKIAVDIIKTHRPPYQDQIKDFVICLPSLYKQIPGFTLLDIQGEGFLDDDPDPTILPFKTEDSLNLTMLSTARNNSGGLSFRILAEIHVFLVLVLQLYKQHAFSDVDLLLPSIVDLIGLQPSLEDRRANGFNRLKHLEFVNFQLKALSLLIYIRRVFKNDTTGVSLNKPLINSCSALLRYFPVDAPYLKKELVLYLRYVIPAEKSGFLRTHVDVFTRSLLDPLLGSVASDALRAQIAALIGDLTSINSEFFNSCALQLSLTFLIHAICDINLLGPSLRVCAKKRNLCFNLLLALKIRFTFCVKKLEKIYQKYTTSASIEETRKLSYIFESSGLDAREVARVTFLAAKTLIPHINSTGSAQDYPHLTAPELKIFSKFFRYGTKLLSFFRDVTSSEVRSSKFLKLETDKELLDLFVSLFTNLHNSSVLELFLKESPAYFKLLFEPSCLQNLPNIFLAHHQTSPVFAFLFLKFFKSNFLNFTGEQSALYFRILKMVLGSTMVLRENEVILKNYVGFLLRNSLTQMLSSGQTLNYLFLLRALFRSIGNSNNDSLYQEFLPQLRTILTGFNRFRTSLRYGVILEVIIELSLSVPVRLSNLVPHMPLIMEPLVTSLLTSSAVNSQGHRTLELCLDTLHMLFADNFMDDIRNDILVQLIRRAAHNTETSLYSIRLIGKMSGAALKPYAFYQNLTPAPLSSKCSVILDTLDSSSILIPIYDILKTVVGILEEVAITANSNIPHDSARVILFDYTCVAWTVIKCYLRAIIPSDNISDAFSSCHPNFPQKFKSNFEKKGSKSTAKLAYLGLLYALRIPQFQVEALPLAVYVTRVFVFILLHSPVSLNLPIAKSNNASSKVFYMRPENFIASLFRFATNTSTDVQHLTRFLFKIIVQTTQFCLKKTLIKFIETTIYHQLKRLCIKFSSSFLYDEKHAALVMVKYICNNFTFYELEHESNELLQIYFDIIAGLFSEISSGTIDAACEHVESVIKVWFNLNQQIQLPFQGHHKEVLLVLVKQLHSNSSMARDTAKRCLKYISSVCNCHVVDILNEFQSFIFSRFRVLAISGLSSLPLTIQLAELDALDFYTKLSPPFSVWSTEYSNEIANSILLYCESDSSYFQNLSSTRHLLNPDILRLSSFKVIGSLKNDKNMYLKVFSSTCKAIIISDEPVLSAAKSVLTSICNAHTDGDPLRKIVSTVIRPLLVKLAQFQQFDLVAAKQMRVLVEAFPDMFNEKLCDQFISTMRDSLNDFILRVNKNDSSTRPLVFHANNELILWDTIVSIFHLMPNATAKFIHPLVSLINDLNIHIGLRYYEPIYIGLLRFLNRYPTDSIEFFIKTFKSDDHTSELFINLLKIDSTTNDLRSHLNKNLQIYFTRILPNNHLSPSFKVSQLNFDSVLIGAKVIWILQKRNSTLLSVFPFILTSLKTLWRILSSLDIKQPSLLLFLCKCFYSHLFFRIDNSILLEFTNLSFEPHLSGWAHKIQLTLIQKMTLAEIMSFFSDASLFYRCNATPSSHRHSLLCFINLLLSERLPQIIKTKVEVLDKFYDCLIAFYDDLLTSKTLIQSQFLLKLDFLELSSIFLTYLSFRFNNKNLNVPSNRLLQLFDIICPYLKIKHFYDPNPRCFSFLIIALIFHHYEMFESSVEETFLGLLRTYYFEFRKIVNHSLSLLFKVLKNTSRGILLVGRLTKKVLNEDNNITLATHHILGIIVEYSDIYYNSRDILFLPIINTIIRPHLCLHGSDEKPTLFEILHVLLDWCEKSSNFFKLLSPVFSNLLIRFVVLNENCFNSLRQPELYVQKNSIFIKEAINRGFFDNPNINFECLEDPTQFSSNIPPNSLNAGPLNDISSTQQYAIVLQESLDLLIFMITKVSVKAFTPIISYFSDDLSKFLFNLSTTDDIKTKIVALFSSIFERVNDLNILETGHFKNLWFHSITWMTQTLSSFESDFVEKSDIPVGLIFLSNLLNIPSLQLLPTVLPTILAIVNKYKVTSFNSESLFREKILTVLPSICGRGMARVEFSYHITFYKFFSKIATAFQARSIAIALNDFLTFALNFLHIDIPDYLDSLVQFLYNFVFLITLTHTMERELHVSAFNKLFILFSDTTIYSPSSLSKVNSIYLAGSLNFFKEVRNLYFHKDKFRKLPLYDKFLNFLAPNPHDQIHVYHSIVKHIIRLFLLTINPSKKILLAAITSILPSYSNFCSYTSSPTEPTLFNDWDLFFSNLTSEIDSNIQTDNSVLSKIYNDFGFGYFFFKDINNSQGVFFDSVTDISFFDGAFAHKMIKHLLSSFWKNLTENQQDDISLKLHNLFSEKTETCFNDLVFLGETLEMAKENIISVVNQNLSLPGFYNTFYSTSFRPEKTVPNRFTSLCRIACLPVSTLNTLFSSITALTPSIVLPPSLVLNISQYQFCPFQAAIYLEPRYCEIEVLNPSEKAALIHISIQSKNNTFNPIHVLSALENIYSSLSETDYHVGVWSISAIFGVTVTGLCLLAHGYEQKASDVFEQLITSHGPDSSKVSQKSDPLYPYESCLWLDSWVKCTQELGQWGRLCEYSSKRISLEKGSSVPDSFDVRNVISSSWKQLDFDSLKKMINLIKNEPRLDLEQYELSYYQVIASLFEKDTPIPKSEDIIEQLNLGLQDICVHMSRLPTIITPRHLNLFRHVHLFAELYEIQKIIISHRSKTKSDTTLSALTNEYKNIQKTWRLHYPDNFGNLSHWSEVLHLRQFCTAKSLEYLKNVKTYNLYDIALPRFTVQNFPIHHLDSISHQVLLLILNGHLLTGWSKFVSIARLQNCFSSCLDCIDAIRSLILSSPQILNSNFWLVTEEVNLYCRLNKYYGKEDPLNRGLELLVQDVGSRQLFKENQGLLLALKAKIKSQFFLFDEAHAAFSESLQKNDSFIGWSGWAYLLEHFYKIDKSTDTGVSAVVAHLNAARLSSCIKTQKHVASALYLLESDPGGKLSECFGIYCSQVDSPVLIKFLSIFFKHLMGDNGEHFSKILCVLGQISSQAVYSFIHFHMSTNSSNLNDESDTKPSILRLKQLSQTIQSSDSVSVYYLESFIQSLYSFEISPIESLYSSIKCCLKIAAIESTTPPFESKQASSILLSRISALAKHLNLLESVPPFNNTISIEDTFSYLSNLWVLVTQSVKELPSKFLITRLSTFFYSLAYNDVMLELPGETTNTRVDVGGIGCTKVVKVNPLGSLVIRPSFINKRLMFLCNNGKRLWYRISRDINYLENLQESLIFSIFDFSNTLFLNTKDTSRRNLYLHVPFYFIYNSNLKIIQEHISCITLLDILIEKLQTLSLTEGDALKLMIEIIQALHSSSNNFDGATLDFEVDHLFPPDLLKLWAQVTYPDPVHFFTFRKRFTVQLALISLFEHVINLIPLYPELCLIDTHQGSLTFSGIKFDLFVDNPKSLTSHDTNKDLLRLTPNIKDFINLIGFQGPYSHTIFAASSAVSHSSSFWPTMLKLTLSQASHSWSDTVRQSIPDPSAFVENFAIKCCQRFFDFGNPDTGLRKISELIEFSMDSTNFMSQDILWYPLL